MIIIPAYNEEDALPGTLEGLAAAHIPASVLVVDDGSVDRTRAVARAGGAAVVSLPFNLGVGSAVRTGLRFAVERGYDRCVVFDADGQHDPRDIRALLDALDEGADVALASRFAPGAEAYHISGIRRAAMRFLSRCVQMLTGHHFSDPTSGFRAFDRAAVELLAREYPVEYLADTVEVLIILSAAGFRTREVASTMRPRAAGRPSSRRARLVVNYLRVIVGLAGAAVFRYRPQTGGTESGGGRRASDATPS